MTANSMSMPASGMGTGGVNVNGSMGPPMMGGGLVVSQQI